MAHIIKCRVCGGAVSSDAYPSHILHGVQCPHCMDPYITEERKRAVDAEKRKKEKENIEYNKRLPIMQARKKQGLCPYCASEYSKIYGKHGGVSYVCSRSSNCSYYDRFWSPEEVHQREEEYRKQQAIADKKERERQRQQAIEDENLREKWRIENEVKRIAEKRKKRFEIILGAVIGGAVCGLFAYFTAGLTGGHDEHAPPVIIGFSLLTTVLGIIYDRFKCGDTGGGCWIGCIGGVLFFVISLALLFALEISGLYFIAIYVAIGTLIGGLLLTKKGSRY